MAIEVIIGNVGAGKTYYATYTIWQEIKKIYNAEMQGTKYKYTHILTNIEGIAENKYVKQLKVRDLIELYKIELEQYNKWELGNQEINMEDVDFNAPRAIPDWEQHTLNDIITHYPNKEDKIRDFKSLNDKILQHINIPSERETAYINHIKPLFAKADFANCLIVIDEAHNFFKTLSGAKERLVSYHRHYDQDYIFITQDLKQLNRKVTGIAQKTILARNPVAKATKTFNYKVYSGGYISFRDTNLLEKVKLKADPDIFRLYHSGSTKKQKSYLLKILIKPLLAVAVVTIGTFFFLTHLNSFSKDSQTHPKHIVKKEITPAPTPEVIKYSTIQVTKIKNFYFYQGKKYYWIEFRQALNKCQAVATNYIKNLDSTITLTYRIKDKECLKNALSTVSQ